MTIIIGFGAHVIAKQRGSSILNSKAMINRQPSQTSIHQWGSKRATERSNSYHGDEARHRLPRGLVPATSKWEIHPKSEQDKRLIVQALETSILFAHLSGNNILEKIADIMSVQPFCDEECIVVKGEIGESFFVLKEGTLDVFVKMGENAAHTYTCSPSAPCPSFGELAIMFASKRKATVKGRGDGC